MELKWLEDFISVVEKGHFARAADARNITQSAFSRRIKSLELWAGTELLDRSQHPVSLTKAGRDFLPQAQEIIRLSHSARSETLNYSRIAETGVTIASLHTLALSMVPKMIADLQNSIGPFESTIVAETRTVEEYLDSLVNGTSDFFMCYRHPSFPFDIDPHDFPGIEIGTDRLLPYINREDYDPSLIDPEGPTIPYLDYSGTSFMSRVVQYTLKRTPFKERLKTVYRATLAESLCNAAIRGLGVAWLPESVVVANPRSSILQCLSEDIGADVQVSIFSARSNKRPIVRRVLQELSGRELVL